jgi:competence protein ComEC
MEAVRPQVVVVSAGEDNRFGHPSPEVLERVAEVGAAVLRTDELGSIEVITDGRAMWWEADGNWL